MKLQLFIVETKLNNTFALRTKVFIHFRRKIDYPKSFPLLTEPKFKSTGPVGQLAIINAF
ncbi:MAG TPA: hypothetical protein DIW81_26400 [Planctomycetaceae bacterium]|nr:hypothetical protein [Rubinisphaera sp.]HCS55072.1 hypothetical protein [Planctomycetaceae bacterium]